MANQYISLRNIQFLLHEVFEAEKLTENPYFQDYDKAAFDMMLEAAVQLADTHLHPFYTEMDQKPPVFSEGEITVHPQMKTVLKVMGESGWIGACASYAHWGQQLPEILRACANYIFNAANNGAIYHNLTTGAADLLLSFASKELQEKYVPKMHEGTWQGTMCLTEPQAGSSLSDILTTATATEEGHYKINGQKIFISGGAHDAVENVVHLVLARIGGAPLGTKGISLFVVPEKRIDTDGNLVDNDVQTAGIFHKMGQKAIATAHLAMGDQGDCHGWLIGEPHRGLSYMFQMMNGARLDVGMIATGIASAAYYASMEYAKERPQGRKIQDHHLKDSPQTLIIHHPDVKRMLLLQKSVMEGALSLILECAMLVDKIKVTEGEEKERNFLLLDLLTPIAKSYPAEMGAFAVSQGLQVFGGYGFCTDFPAEQFHRDIRITSIYEGTTGIQAKDLLGRKITQKGGKGVTILKEEILGTAGIAKEFEPLQTQAEALLQGLEQVGNISQYLLKLAEAGEMDMYLADATLYLDAFGTLVIGWQWLKQAVKAQQAMATQQLQGEELDFYQSKLHTCNYFYKYEMRKIESLGNTIMDKMPVTTIDSLDVFI